MRRIGVAFVLSFAGLSMLALPSGASAATTVGSNLAGTPNSVPSANISMAPRTQPPGVTLPLTAPSAGVIVQILLKHGSSGPNPGAYGFRVLSGSAAMYTTTGAPTELPDFPWPASDTPDTDSFIPALGGVPKGIPIAAGNRLGMVRIGGTGMQGVSIRANSSMGELDQVVGVHNSGPLFYDTLVPNELMVQYRIEPDADLDGFGDETQDRCPTNAATQAACPATATPATTPAKKCKKKKRKKKGKSSAEAAKKKKKGGCKKKRKKKK